MYMTNRKLVLVHIPKTGGTYSKRLLQANEIGNSLGHVSLDKWLREKSGDTGQDVVFAVLRDPVSWYKSLYLSLRRKVQQGAKPLNPLFALGRLKFLEFVKIMLDVELFRKALPKLDNNLGDHLEETDPFAAITQAYFRFKSPKDWPKIGFYSFCVIYQLFPNAVWNMPFNEVFAKCHNLVLPQVILHQERLQSELQSLINKTFGARELRGLDRIINFNNYKGVNLDVSPQQKSEIYMRDALALRLWQGHQS